MRPTALAMALLLAACGQQQDDAAPLADAPAETPEAAGSDAGSGMTLDLDMATGRIPERFHGLWDSAADGCDPASDTRIRITGSRLEYYESVGDVSRVSAAGDDVIAELAMTGEGMTWTDRIRLQLTSAGGREALLVLPESGSDAGLRPAPRWRCPA